MKCQIYYNYVDESWPSGSQGAERDRLPLSSIPHVPPSRAANFESNIGVKGFHLLCMALLKQIPPGIFNSGKTDNGQSCSS